MRQFLLMHATIALMDVADGQSPGSHSCFDREEEQRRNDHLDLGWGNLAGARLPSRQLFSIVSRIKITYDPDPCLRPTWAYATGRVWLVPWLARITEWTKKQTDQKHHGIDPCRVNKRDWWVLNIVAEDLVFREKNTHLRFAIPRLSMWEMPCTWLFR